MAYDNQIERYTFGNFDFGGGANETFSIIGRKNKGAYLWDYGVFGVIEVFAAGTATPMMSVGTPSDPDAYGEEFDFGALADNHGMSVRSQYLDNPALGGTSVQTYILNAGKIPINQEIVVTCVAGTGSGLTGQAIPFVDLRWDK